MPSNKVIAQKAKMINHLRIMNKITADEAEQGSFSISRQTYIQLFHRAFKEEDLELIKYMLKRVDNNIADLLRHEVPQDVPVLSERQREIVYFLIAGNRRVYLASSLDIECKENTGNAMLIAAIEYNRKQHQLFFDRLKSLVFDGPAEELEELLAWEGVEVLQATNLEGVTLFDLALKEENIKVLQFLWEKLPGMDTNLPASYEACTKNPQLLPVLFPRGLDHKYRDDKTPLYRAVSQNDTRGVTFLLEHGADPNILCSHNMTAIHCAANLLNFDLVSILLEHKA